MSNINELNRVIKQLKKIQKEVEEESINDSLQSLIDDLTEQKEIEVSRHESYMQGNE